jgi:type III secretory pathway component EscV
MVSFCDAEIVALVLMSVLWGFPLWFFTMCAVWWAQDVIRKLKKQKRNEKQGRFTEGNVQHARNDRRNDK